MLARQARRADNCLSYIPVDEHAAEVPVGRGMRAALAEERVDPGAPGRERIAAVERLALRRRERLWQRLLAAGPPPRIERRDAHLGQQLHLVLSR